ncbi:rho guanine nucleotide exchange factor 18 isoform X2 [Xenopus tropicalis]|uniref:Rho guanine nucleotide exchange factor 18 isoform X2 n=1 Tax=Xenopus tropicalis TaxID=8364 RepID=A0A8J1JSW5_XENTR|nr:rho guanine nucleotide exchange factor 18 isoform X2 [Xenopus tropicalis]
MVQIDPGSHRHTAGLNVLVKVQSPPVQEMSDSILNNSWPSFSKLWLKRWSFKRASECKPCSTFSAIPDSRSVTPDADPNSEEAFLLAEEKDDLSVDLNDYSNDIISSSEDLTSIDSSLQGTEYYKDLVQMDAAEDPRSEQEEHKLASASFCMADETDITLGKGEVIITYTKPFICPVSCGPGAAIEENITENTTEGDKGSYRQLLPIKFEEPIPVLVRSLSTSRRHSWDDAVSPSDTVRRLSLSNSEIANDGERDIEESAAATMVHSMELPGPWVTNLSIQADVGELGVQETNAESKEVDSHGKRLRSKSVPSTLDKISTTRISRSLESSCPVIEVIQTPHLETTEKDHVEPTHVLFVQQVLQELKQYHGTKNKQEGSREPKQNLTWFEFLSNEPEETTKSEKVEKGTKVKRRLSSLRSRVTGSWQKDKGKIKEELKDKGKEAKDTWINTNGHELVPGCFSSHAKCTLCTKALANRHGLQCMYCAVNVHKNCKALLPECTSNKLKKDNSPKPVASSLSCQQASLKENPRIAIVGLDGTHAQARGLGMTVTHRGGSRVEIQSNSGSRASTSTAEMDDVDSGLSRLKLFSDENVSLAPDSVFLEDSYTNVKSELDLDALEFEAGSWSCAVDPLYLKKQKKEVIKRQDVIYELMQTEMHHVRTLKIMLRVYSRALSEELQYGNKDIHQIFPCVDDLLELHVNFLARFKERRKESMEEGSDRNYMIQKVGDILVQQFSGESGERMREKYGIFCSQHNKAVSRYKDLLRDSKKFQNLMKKIGNSSIVRRLGVQECILLVTQRITKYPVLVERIIQNTEEGTEDYETLTQAIALIKDTITDVDSRVHESEKVQRLREIVSKMELKSSGKLKNGTFRKQDILRRQLLHDGVLYWKTASGRLKDILAVLLTDILLLLQEKDQKYSLSPVDNKAPVISLQKLIVREVANEEKAMFLISASNTGAEMYEIHTNSKEERNFWMNIIRGAVESCPVQDAEILNEAEEEKKLFTERAAKIKEFQERLNQKDYVIVQSLNEKLQTCMEMAELYGYEDLPQEPRITLLPRAETGENLEGKGILHSAVTAAERIHYMLLSQTALLNPLDEANNSATILPRRSETFGGYDNSFKQKVKDRRAVSMGSDSQVQDGTLIEPVVSTTDNNSPPVCHETEMITCVETLLQHLYSLQAVISQQDSYVEVQKEREKQFRQQSSRGNMLLEQEKQRNFEKQREELGNVQKMQDQLRLEKQKWERERERQQREAEAMENMLRQRMGDSELQLQKLHQERDELEAQRKEYQHDLERLRESQKAVEKDRERLELMKRIKATSAGAGSFSSDLIPVVVHSAASNGEGMLSTEAPSHLPLKPLAKTTMSMSAADYLERPEVARRESNVTDIRPALKKEVPIHLLSATNQIQKQAALTRQQIPTHLAMDKGKEKPSRGKASHRTESTASLDHRLGFPPKLSGKEDGTVRSRRSASPSPFSSQTVFFQQDPVGQAEPSLDTPFYTPVLYRPSSFHLLPPSFPPQPPPPPAEDEGSKENVIYF